MELILSTIASGGLVGAANQYACLLIVSIAARLNWIALSPQMAFMESLGFIIVTAVFWLLTIAPAFGSFLSPGLSNLVHTLSGILSGFIVPVSSAILSLAAIGVIVDFNPEMQKFLESLKFLNDAGSFGPTGYFVAAGGAVAATTITGLRALSKPAISASTGTTGTVDAPLFSILENVAAIVLMGLAYLFARINPWLLVALLAVAILLVLALVAYAIYQLKKLKTGIGKVLYLAQAEPRAGLAIVAEFFVWGSGWLAWKAWGRGAIMLFFLALWLTTFLLVQPLFIGLFAIVPFLIPIVGFLSILLLILIFVSIGTYSARALLHHIEKHFQIIPKNQPETGP